MMDAIAMLQRHGGSIAAARAAFPRAREPWLDLSTGVNPEPWQYSGDDWDFACLPDPADTAALEAAAARVFGAAAAHVAAVPGSDAALRLLPYLTGARRIGIVSPTYSGHSEAWISAGCTVEFIGRGNIADSYDALVITNPNNPDGAILTAEEISALAARQEARGGWLVVDEAFADAVPHVSVAAAPGARTIVLRSFGKFYGLPGLRLGFVVATPEVVQRVRASFGDWPVNAAAVVMGHAAYEDSVWRAETLRSLMADADSLDRSLVAAGFKVVGGTPLFRLVEHAQAERIFSRLGQAGILVRSFDYNPKWLRFGLPSRANWHRLRNALESL